MSAPDSSTASQIVPTNSVILLEGQRSLAAIVFTDTVNFSGLMSRDEERTRRLVARDLKNMRLLCEAYGGQVMKSTGDGLLILFGSVVQAVACALEIQRSFREQNSALPGAERLRHRIGIHLGDVFRQENDVMGDGVNIAARLQAIGWAGGVCVSGTVFEVVRNRLPFYIVWRKDHKLKNVGKVRVYQLVPVGGRFGALFRIWQIVRDRRVVRTVAILSTLTLFFVFPPTIRISTPSDSLQKYAEQLSPVGGSTLDSDDDHDDDAASRANYPEPGRIAATEDDFSVVRFQAMKKYDFAAMSNWLMKHDVRGRDPDKLLAVSTAMQELFVWLVVHLQPYNEANPLAVRDNAGRIAYQFWLGPANALNCKLTANGIVLTGDNIPPAIMAQMAARLLDQDLKEDDPSAAQLLRGLEYFNAAYDSESRTDLRTLMKGLLDSSKWNLGNS